MSDKQASLRAEKAVPASLLQESKSEKKARSPALACKETLSHVKELLSYAVGSSKLSKITIEEKDGMIDIRPSLHLVLQAPTGSIKTTIMKAILSMYPSVAIDSMTVPGMVGTYENMMLVPGGAWTGRKKLLLFDEFTFGRHFETATFVLKLLEEQEFHKSFGRFIPDREVERDGDLYYSVKSGKIDMKTRFSAIICTMRRIETQRGMTFRAFANRCLLYSFKFSMEDLKWVLEHTKLFEPFVYDPEPVQLVRWKDYKKTKTIVERFIDKSSYQPYVKTENYARLVGDAVRIRCINPRADKTVIERIAKWKLDMYEKIGSYFPA